MEENYYDLNWSVIEDVQLQNESQNYQLDINNMSNKQIV